MVRSIPDTAVRQPWLDVWRGLAMVWMTVFHFCFDLNHFGLWRQDFLSDPFWLTQRTLIVSLFLLCAGWGQALALTTGQPLRRFWRRWAQIVGCALLVSVGSWTMFPATFITFGVLHGMAVMLLMLRVAASATQATPRVWAWALAALLCLLAPYVLPQHLPAAWAEWLNSKAWNWLGLVTRKPITEDYVPVLPWTGVLLLGYLLGHWLANGRPLQRQVPALLIPLALLGRWPLSYYMLHQPVLIGALVLVGFASRG